jgi:peptide/nickel transport system permease protein
VLRGDFGISYIDNQPVSDKIWEKFKVSFAFIFLSILLAYIVSIPIGIYAAYKKGSKFDKISSIVLFVMYSMPSFFIGTLLLYTFANPDVLVWFPESGFQDPSIYQEDWGVFQKMIHHGPYMVLPLIAYTYSSFAFLSRIMRVGMIDVMGQDFIRTARAKGLNEKTVVIKHALRNSLLPIITVFANIFPVAIGGSVIIEVIFSLPGMGFETFSAILNYDYPMIVAIFTISGFLTVIGYLVADILYAVVDPRISYH